MAASTAHVRGVDLAYELIGDAAATATPLVWGHGLTSSRADEDRVELVDLARVGGTRRVLRYDARGHGESGDLRTADEGHWDQLAADQLALVDALGLDEVILGGASMGAATALHAVLTPGVRVRGLVLVIPPTGWETRAAQTDMYETMAGLVESRGVEPLIAASASLPAPDPMADDGGAFKARRAEALRAAPPHRLAAVFRGAAGTDLPPPDAIATIDVPTLILAWTGDPGHPMSTAERLHDLIAGSELSIASTSDELATWTDRVIAFLATR